MFELSRVLYATLSLLIVLFALVSARYTGVEQEDTRVGSIFQPEPDPTIFRPSIESAQFSGASAIELKSDTDYMD